MTEADVLEQMSELGLDPEHLVVDGARHYCKTDECRGAEKKGWYRLFRLRLRDGREVITGTFGNYRHGGSSAKVRWRDHTPQASPEERARIAAQWRAQRDRAEAARRRDADSAADDAVSTWRRGLRLEEALAGGLRSSYLERKGVFPEACRLLSDGTVIVPMIRYDSGELVGVQTIAGDGSKRFGYGTAKQGAACRLGAIADDTDVAFLVEGYATGLSVRQALHGAVPVFVAFDAGNLAPVLELLRARYPATVFGLCADDDYLSGEAGWSKAVAAAKKFPPAFALRPVFERRRHGEKWTDFNDLAVHEGIAAVSVQLMAFLAFCRQEAAVA